MRLETDVKTDGSAAGLNAAVGGEPHYDLDSTETGRKLDLAAGRPV